MFASSGAGFTLGVLVCIGFSLYAGWALLIDRPRAQASAPERVADRIQRQAEENFASGMSQCVVSFTANEVAGARLDLMTPRVVDALQRKGISVVNVQHTEFSNAVNLTVAKK